MKKIILMSLLVLFSLTNTLKAQISYGGTPTSFGSNFRDSALDKVALTPHALPYLNMEEIRQEDRSKPNNRFAKATFINVKPENSGLWQTLPTGDRLWRVLLKTQSEEVTGMCLRFDQFKLPQGGKLFIYTADKGIILGAFTYESNHESGVFATTLIRGKEVVMEYYEPKEVKGEIVLSLNRIDQAYKNPHMEKPKGAGKRMGGKDFGDAESCNININCNTLTNDWQDEKRGVVRINLVLPDGSSFCSGSLIGNTSLNDVPYLLTADHCAEGVTTAMLNQWTFDFNYDIAAANCANPVEPTLQSMTGGQVKANSFNSDFYLIQLNQAIPASYNAYFNGWDRVNTPSASGTVCIQHPAGDVKKFSLDTGAPVNADDNGNTVANGDYWKVTWNNGVTEGGSSGSPLFSNTSQGRIVGQLLGGSSFCTPVSAQDDPDVYGKISTSWTGEGTSSTRLSNWLDPNNTGATTLNGRYVGSIVATTFLPALNATGVATNNTLQITFNKPVSKGTGNVILKRVSDNTIIQTIAVTSASVTTTGNTATITPTSALPLSTQIYVEIANTAFKDANNVNFAGISNNTTWRFTTINDATAPTLVSLSPTHNATLVAVDANLLMTMSENVKKGAGNIVIKKTTDNSIVEIINITNANVTIANTVVTINPATTLAALTDYYVEVANGAIQDIANNNYAGFAGNTTWAFKTDTETIPPTVLSLNPANNNFNVALASNFVMTFSEDVKKGTGNIIIRKTSDNTAVETIAITDAKVSIAGAVVTINPANDLVVNTDYYIEINAGAIQDMLGNSYAGITGNNTWTFASLDNILPTLTTLSPANNSLNILANTNLIMTFSENVKKGTSGSISIKRVNDGSIVENISITNTIITALNNTITINPTNDLPFITAVYVEVSNGAIQDMAGNNYAGFSGNADWRFATANETTPPTVVTFSPANNTTNFPGANNLTITFSETVVKGTGNIVIKKVSDNSIFETMDINGARVTLAGTLLTINPTDDLIFNTDYYVEITSGGFQDLASNNYAGIINNTTWRFKTDFSTSVEDNQLARALTIYPNPTDRFATIQVRQGMTLQEVGLRVIDLGGKAIWTTQLKQLAEKQAFDWITVPAGSYLLEIKTKQGTAIKPFIKQ